MVASAIGRPPNPSPINSTDDGLLETGQRENLSQLLNLAWSWLQKRLVLLAIFTLAVAPFGYSYMNAYQDYSDLQTQIRAKEAVLANGEQSTEQAQEEFRIWTDAHAAATEAQILELKDSDLVDRLIAAALSAGITIQSISTSNNTTVPVGTEVYDATPFILRVSGSIAAIESYISLLEGDAVEALEIQNTLIAPQDTGAAEGEEEVGESFTGIVSAIVFNRPIDPSELDPEQREALSRRVTDAELDAAAAGGAGAPRSGQ